MAMSDLHDLSSDVMGRVNNLMTQGKETLRRNEGFAILCHLATTCLKSMWQGGSV